MLLLPAAAGWWRLTARDTGGGFAVPGTPFFVGLLVIGSLCVACELRAFAATRHQRAQHDDAQDRDGQAGGGGSAVLWLGLLELVLATVAAVGTVIGVVLVLVAVVGLGAHVIAG